MAGPGFVNITLEAASQGEVASRIVVEGAHYGQGTSQHGRWINIEFISANPTGPIHLGHTRWAAVGDAIARVLAAQGAVVTREFYINDRGVQMDRFGESIMNAAHGLPAPEAGLPRQLHQGHRRADRGQRPRHHAAARRRAAS